MSNDKSIKLPSGFEIRENTGNLFKTTSDNPNAPLYSGNVNINGQLWRLAIWKNEKYVSCKFSQDNHVGGHDFEKKKVSKSEPQVKEEFGDDIPF
tara:strand:- start:261 stop:545 length:285 start_codon:yes stop_codon:yes gene_type:complete